MRVLSHGPRLLAAILFTVAGCGDNPASPDAGSPDAPVSLDAPATPAICQGLANVHVETSDAANMNSPEPTMQTAGASSSAQICGALTPTDGKATDRDLYAFTLATPARIRVRVDTTHADAVSYLFAAVLVPLENANPPDDDGRRGEGYAIGDHIVFAAPNCWAKDADCASQVLPAGTYLLRLAPLDGPDKPQATAIEYHATISVFDADAECVTPGTVTYQESHDADPGNDQNDVFAYGTEVSDNPDDEPEPADAAFTIEPGAYRIAGVAGTHASVFGHDDLDTYTIVTGPTTEALDIRLAWSGTSDDHVYFGVYRERGSGYDAVNGGWSMTSPQYAAMPVLPSTTYLLSIGALTGTASGKPYDVTICGSTLP